MKTMQYLKNVATLQLNNELCNGCRMCTIVCPHAVFKIVDKKAHIVDINDCMECGACALNCQTGAIKVKSGVGCAAAVINGMMKGKEANCECSL